MRSIRFYMIISMVSMVFLSSCENSWLNCVRGNDRIARESNLIGNFTKVSSYGEFVVINAKITGTGRVLKYK